MSSCSYKLGYAMCIFEGEDLQRYAWLETLSKKCERFVLGIPDEAIIARIYGDKKKYSAEERKNFCMQTGWFSDVKILDAEHLQYQKMYEELQFDICFYGSEYGLKFEQDQRFMASKTVAFESVLPIVRNTVVGADAMRIALENVQRQQKIVLFGTGVYFDIFMKYYGDKYRPTYAVDSDCNKWGSQKSGLKLEAPEVIQKEKEEDLLIILCSKDYRGMYSKIRKIGDYNYRTLLYRNEIAILEEFSISAVYEKDYLKRIHEILLILMKEFDRVCEENNLRYYMICGSLIGAIRHKDFIPWDDDIDLAMPRKDYKKLCKIAKKKWGNDTFQWLSYNELGNGAFLDFMPRLFYMKEKFPTKVFAKVHGKATADVEDRAFLDIYVMDHAHQNQSIHLFTMNAMKIVYNLCMGHRAFVDYESYRKKMSDKMIRIMKILHQIGRFIPLRLLTGVYDMLARSANWNIGCKDYFMDSCAITCIERRFEKKLFGNGKRVPYHDMEVMVPEDYDGLLLAMGYKNYMELPRLSIRKPSHYFNSDIEIW